MAVVSAINCLALDRKWLNFKPSTFSYGSTACTVSKGPYHAVIKLHEMLCFINVPLLEPKYQARLIGYLQDVHNLFHNSQC